MEGVLDNIYEVDVAFRKMVSKGVYERAWKVKQVAEAIANQDELLRCKDCHGAVRLHGKHVSHGPTPHAEHRSRADSEYCRAGHYFRQAKDGREHRMSGSPIT